MTQTIEAQKLLANKLILKLRAFDPYALLAGGAPRDWYYGNLATDLDIYVYQQTESCTLQSIKTRLNSLGFTYNLLGFDEFKDNYEKNQNIRCVINILGFDTPVQLIILRTPTWNIVESFPLSICKIWYTPEKGIVRTSDFKLGEKTNSIFLTNPLYANGDKYVKKILGKFSGVAYVGGNRKALFEKLINE